MKTYNKFFYENLINPILIFEGSGEILYKNNAYETKMIIFNSLITNNISFFYKDFLNHISLKKFNELITIPFENKVLKIKLFPIEFENKNVFLMLFEKECFNYESIDKLINYIDEVVVFFNEHGVITKMNSLCDKLLPFSREEVLGKNIETLIENNYVKKPVIQDVIKTKKTIRKNVLYPGGKIISFTGVPFLDSNNNFKGGVLTGRDITRLLNLESDKNSEINITHPDDYICDSIVMKNIKKMIQRAAVTDSSIFLSGESGTGKEILARLIYKFSCRRNQPFVAINCGAIPSDLLEAEFFGYEEGAFTGAKKGGKKGIFEEYNNGTIFLDEIGELPMSMQTKLLRVIQEGKFTKIGCNKTINVNLRFISATNISLEDLHCNNKFRQDLYYRLSVIPIHIPPLRERKDDLNPLIKYFLNYFNQKYNRNLIISNDIFKLFFEYNWPGNIRELKNLIERFAVLSQNDLISEDDFYSFINLDSISTTEVILPEEKSIIIKGYSNLNEAYQKVDQIMISKAIKKFNSIQKASYELGINPSTIHRKLKNKTISLD